MLEISGVTAVRSQYWQIYNMKRDQLIERDIEILNRDFLKSSIYSKEERNLIKKKLDGGDLSTVKPEAVS